MGWACAAGLPLWDWRRLHAAEARRGPAPLPRAPFSLALVPRSCSTRPAGANWHFHDFVANWVHHVAAHGITNYLVGAMDVETGQVGAAVAGNASWVGEHGWAGQVRSTSSVLRNCWVATSS